MEAGGRTTSGTVVEKSRGYLILFDIFNYRFLALPEMTPYSELP